MANYANIIADIQAAITTNDNEEITGEVLREVLLNMLQSLGVGFQYAGVASPSTNPGTPDQRVFYLATPGDYSYFGPVSVPDGQLGVFRYDGAWRAEMIDIGVTQLRTDVYGVQAVNINVHAITSCGGYIDETGKWASNQTYYGGLVDVTPYRGRRVTIVPVQGGGGSCAFVTAGFSAGQNVAFATGWTAYDQLTETKTYIVPDDAVYLYVYLYSAGTSYRPQSITILAEDSLLQDVADLQQDVEEINEELEIARKVRDDVDVNAIQSCGSYITANGTWGDTATTNYYGGLVPVTAFRGCPYEIVSGGGGSFAFVTAGVSLGNAVSFATGWSGYETLPSGTTKSGTVPDDAVYLYVYLYSNGTSYRPQRISFYIPVEQALADIEAQIERAGTNDFLSLFHWNIGHFSNGVSPNSAITASDYLQKVDAFRAILSKDRPSLYGIVEYSAIFGKNTNNVNVNTKDELFNFMETQFESSQLHYACYALFGAPNVPLYNVQINDFDCLVGETITHTTLAEAQDFRYISADLYAFGVSIKLVVTHLAFDLNRPGYLTGLQIAELIQKYNGYQYVVMLGDWNVTSFDEYTPFVNAGYTLVNDGSFLTYGGKALDNICVKGLTAYDAKMITTNLSDHNALLCKVIKQ